MSTNSKNAIKEIKNLMKQFGFLADEPVLASFKLEDNTIFSYKCSNVYNKQSEGGIIWNDPTIDIDWGVDIEDIIISDKDSILPMI